MTDYPYANGDLLEKRNTYFYSPFRGYGFLTAWVQQRDMARRTQTATSAQPQIDTQVDSMLNLLWQKFSDNQDTDIAPWQELDHLLQRFEVSKRLHGEYNDRWRPTNPDDYRNMERYVRFAEILNQAYRLRPKLQYLNGLLKCMDTLSALIPRLNALQKERLNRLVDHERFHIRAMACTHGLSLPEETT